MANLKEVRIRIESVKSTQQITKAMKMVAASKLRKAQVAILKLRPYAFKLKEVINNIIEDKKYLEAIEKSGSCLTKVREEKKILLVVIASNKGLCGAFNSNIIKATNNLIKDKYSKQADKTQGDLSLICIGKKVSDFYTKNEYNVVGTYDQLFDSLTFENIIPVAEKIMKSFANKEYDKVEIIYNEFKNAAKQVLTTEQFLPVIFDHTEILEKKGNKIPTDFIFEPNKEKIINELIPRTLKIQFYKALLDSNASEQGARMTAMHIATDNAIEILKDLKLSYNKARQATITKEMLEIVSGAEALKG
jgi:F-type H+-transporting ATPase subunit gamma